MEITIHKICYNKYHISLDSDAKHLIQRLLTSLTVKMTRNSIKIMHKVNKKILTRRILKLAIELSFHINIKQKMYESIENTLNQLREHHGNIKNLNQDFCCSIFRKLINNTFSGIKIDSFIPPFLSDISFFITSYVLDNCYNRVTNNLTHHDIIASTQNNTELQHLFYGIISPIETIQTEEIDLNIDDLNHIIYADINEMCETMDIKINNDSNLFKMIIGFVLSQMNTIVRKMIDINDRVFGYDDCISALGKLNIETTDTSFDVLEEHSISSSFVDIVKMYNPEIQISEECLTLIYNSIERNICCLLRFCNNYVTYNNRKSILCRDIEFIINLVSSKDQ